MNIKTIDEYQKQAKTHKNNMGNEKNSPDLQQHFHGIFV